MNSPSRVISFVNAAHFIDHYAMLICRRRHRDGTGARHGSFGTLPYATPGLFASARARCSPAGLATGLEPPPHDGDLLCRHRRSLMIAVGFLADAAAARHRAALDRPVRLDLSSGRHGHDRVLCRPSRPRDGLNGVWGNRCRLLGVGHRRDRPISRLALGIHRAASLRS